MATAIVNVGSLGIGQWRIYVDEISSDFAANTSYVRVRGYLINNGTTTSYNNSSISKSVSGSAAWSGSGPFSVPAGGSLLFIDQYFTIAHNSDGTKTVTFTVAYGATGTSTFGTSGSVGVSLGLTTLNAAPGAPVVSANTITTTTAVVTCTIPPDNRSAITDYDIQVDNNSDFSSLHGTYNRGDTVTGLLAGVTYYMRAKAYNAVGASTWSAVVSFVAASAVPSTPGAPTISNILVDGARAAWAIPAANGSAITGYTLQVAKDTGFTTGLLTFLPTASPYDFTGIDPATVYYARLKATNGVGDSAYGAYATFTSGATVPGAPTALAFGSLLATSGSATFTPPADNGGVAITSYSLVVATDAGFTQNVKTFAGSGSPIAISGLLSGMGYFGKVRAANVVGNGAYSTVQPFTTAGGTPTITTPTTGQTVTVGVGYPRVIVTSLGLYSASQIVAEFSKSATFASGIITATLNVTAQSVDNSYTVADTLQYLSVGTWYVRVKVVNTATAYVTAWSTAVSYIQSHTPSGSVVSPTASAVNEYFATTNFVFNFTDLGPYDVQSAYRLVIENNATGTSLYDSGKVALVTTLLNQQTTIAVAVGAGNKNTTLRWRVMVWDGGDTPSAWSGYGLFTLTDPPSVAVTLPASGGTVDSGSPTINWTLSLFSGGTQASTNVSIYETLTNDLVWSSVIAGVVLTATPPSVVLLNGTSYYVVVTVTDSNGIVGSDASNFSSVFESPPAIGYNVDISGVEDLGYVRIEWNGSDPDPAFVAWKVYRRIQTESIWELLVVLTDINARSHLDYMFKSGYSYIYSVTQVAIRSEADVESPVGYYVYESNEVTDNRVSVVSVSKYWFIDTEDNSKSVMIPGVVSDASVLEFESATTHVIGRGRHRDVGDELGYSGTIESKVRGTDRISPFRSAIEDLVRKRKYVYLRTPFGRTFQVGLGNPNWTPLPGTGMAEMGDMSIPYEEVS